MIMNTQDHTSTGICDFFGYPEVFRFSAPSEDEIEDNYFERYGDSGLVKDVMSLHGTMTERQMIRMIYPGIRDVDEELSQTELIKALFPSIDGYVDALSWAIDFPRPDFPLVWGTLTVGFCVKDELLHVVHTYQTRTGLVLRYLPASLDRSWNAEVLLVEATPF